MKTLEQKLPLHIKIISLFYPVINYQRKYGKDEPTVNLSKGEIDKFNLRSKYKKKIGENVERLTWDDKMNEYDTTWANLGKNYFKQISKIPSRSC